MISRATRLPFVLKTNYHPFAYHPFAYRGFHLSTKSFNSTKNNSTKESIKSESEKSSDNESNDNNNKNSFGKSVLSNTAILFIGALVGTSWASFNLCKNPPEFLFPHTSTLPLSSTLSPNYGDSNLVITELKKFLKSDQVSESKDEIDNHADSYFSTDHPTNNEKPDAVVFPETTEEVSKILKICHDHHVPIVPFTGGTSLEGHYITTRRGISLDMSRMNKILSTHKDDLDITVQAGVSWEDLRDYLQPFGFLFGPDPGPGACIGGMCGTSCSGTNAARYGTMRENVISLTAVLADGTIVKTRRRPRKTAAGYNLTQLFIGSEGTLCIVTEATLKLNVIPKYENVAVVSFPSMLDAADAVAKVVQSGVQFNAMELLDSEMMKYVNQSGNVTKKYDELPTLMFKLGGNSSKVVDSITNDIKDICVDCNCGKKNFKFASSEEEKEELWTARKVALWSTMDVGRSIYGPDAQLWTTDVAVPISKLVESLESTRKMFDQANLNATIVSHAGDGNYHTFIIYPKSDTEKVNKVVQKMVAHALELDGTVTGEHGVGIGKRDFLIEELGEVGVDVMRKIKFALDPLSLLNPDKIFKIDSEEKRSH
ncbi:D-lactate ferricytochrome c oxidoreductase [Pichia californica]|uniref:D-lactate dehydrogenase (cytochrome) n=1 Tax=Pichia californica TaxID=460514 RepID=A0A9P6WQQ2_9ASCO|nr:D-lactate ferricytochrome c oxidoreductase [[Candida] californica]KAG0690463.1 D-lactate ferricytochrome c oxidoreductase [[Candida] californica]